MFLVGLVGASIAMTIYAEFVIYTFPIHGFGTNFPTMLRWVRPGLWDQPVQAGKISTRLHFT